MTTDIDFDRPRSARRRAPTPAPVARLVGRVACAVCGLRADVLICKECAERPEVSRAAVKQALASVLERIDEALDEFEWHVPAYRPYFKAIDTAQIEVDAQRMTQLDFDRRLAAHKAEGGGWRAAIEHLEERDQTIRPLGIERQRLERALLALDKVAGGPIVACKDCATYFEDLSGHGLCDGCLCEHINGAGELELDDE